MLHLNQRDYHFNQMMREKHAQTTHNRLFNRPKYNRTFGKPIEPSLGGVSVRGLCNKHQRPDSKRCPDSPNLG